MPNNTQQVEQVDREAAAEYISLSLDPDLVEGTRDGRLFSQLSEAFARHRLSSTRASDELLEVLKAIVTSWDANTHERERYVADGRYGPYWSPTSAMVNSEHIARARAAISNTTPDRG